MTYKMNTAMENVSPSRRLVLVLKILPLVCLPVFLTALLSYGSGRTFSFTFDGIVQSQIRLLPLYFLFAFAGIILGNTMSALLTIYMAGLLAIANRAKISIVHEPLSFSDITNLQHWKVALSFTGLLNKIFLALFFVLLIVSVVYSVRKIISSGAYRVPKAKILISAILLLSFYQLLPGDWVVRNKLSGFFNKYLGIKYVYWDWNSNVRKNGLYFHLVQTSSRTIPPRPDPGEISKYMSFEKRTGSNIKAPANIFYILCESCWFDENHFKTEFAPLFDQGFRVTEAISPEFGGNTVNVSFEMLTSLPARGLSGIIFQEYANLFAFPSMTLPQRLRGVGYQTVELHDYFADFWRRNIVIPRFGFDRFISLEDMNYTGSSNFPEDTILFDSGISEFNARKSNKTFFHIETVHNHGPYTDQNDLGVGDYKNRLAQTIDSISNFVKKIKGMSGDYLIVVYGDHKPDLGEYFFREGVFSKEDFDPVELKNGVFQLAFQADQNRFGGVPVLILSSRPGAVTDSLLEKIRGKPIYCAASFIDNQLIGSGYIGSLIVAEDACSDEPSSYKQRFHKVPATLYSYMLFGKTSDNSPRPADIAKPAPKSQPMVIHEYNPVSISAGKPFNAQPDGSSAIWFRGDGFTKRTSIYWNGEQLNTDFSGNLISCLVRPEMISRAGKVTVQIMDPYSGAKSQEIIIEIKP